MHSNVREHPCSWCPRAFNEKSDLNRHFRKVHMKGRHILTINNVDIFWQQIEASQQSNTPNLVVSLLPCLSRTEECHQYITYVYVDWCLTRSLVFLSSRLSNLLLQLSGKWLNDYEIGYNMDQAPKNRSFNGDQALQKSRLVFDSVTVKLHLNETQGLCEYLQGSKLLRHY